MYMGTRTKDFRQHAKRDWDASTSAFAEHFGHTRGKAAIRKAAEEWCKAHPEGGGQWTAKEESWVTERVPADTHLANSYVQGIARAFEDEFKYKRTAASIRYKIEHLRDRAHRACEESWAGCLQGAAEQ